MPRCGGVRVIRGDSYNVTRVSTLTRVTVTPCKRIVCTLLRTQSPMNVVVFPRLGLLWYVGPFFVDYSADRLCLHLAAESLSGREVEAVSRGQKIEEAT